MQTSFHLAQEMARLLGAGALLLRALQAREASCGYLKHLASLCLRFQAITESVMNDLVKEFTEYRQWLYPARPDPDLRRRG